MKTIESIQTHEKPNEWEKFAKKIFYTRKPLQYMHTIGYTFFTFFLINDVNLF